MRIDMCLKEREAYKIDYKIITGAIVVCRTLPELTDDTRAEDFMKGSESYTNSLNEQMNKLKEEAQSIGEESNKFSDDHNITSRLYNEKP